MTNFMINRGGYFLVPVGDEGAIPIIVRSIDTPEGSSLTVDVIRPHYSIRCMQIKPEELAEWL